MIIKKFLGKTEEEAITAAKKELGDSVVIMNVRTVKPGGLFGMLRAKQFEVTVALEEKDILLRPVREAARESLSGAVAMPAAQQEVRISERRTSADAAGLEKRLDSLQLLLESQIGRKEEYLKENAAGYSDMEAAMQLSDREKNQEEESDKKEAEITELDKFIRLLYNTMLDNEVDEKYANQILEDIDRTKKPNMPFDYVLASIYQKMVLRFGKAEGITASDKGVKVIVFLGPTGVGKTTTIAKLASDFVVEKKNKVALLTSDTYRIAAAEQLRTYANILEVPFRVIYTKEELNQAIDDFREYDYIFVDTAGHSHQNAEQMEKMKEMIASIEENVESQAFLVLSATTKYRDLRKIADKYKNIIQYQLIFTKLDETLTLGNLYNMKLCTDNAIAFVTYGQNVPNDIENFSPQKTVKQILGGK